MNIQLVKMV